MTLQEAYKILQETGVSQKLIIKRLSEKGIAPARSREYSPTQLSRLVLEGYAPNASASAEIIRMAQEYKP